MIAHERRKDAQFKPADQQVFGGITAKPAQIRTGKEEAAHVQSGEHLQVQFQVSPPGAVVALPETAVAVCADIARAAEEQEAVIGIKGMHAVHGGPCHAIAVEVVDLVMAHTQAVHVMIEGLVVVAVVGHGGKGPLQLPVVVHAQVFASEFIGHAVGQVNALHGIEQGGFIHVIPETVDAGFEQRTVQGTEPGPGAAVEVIGEEAQARPDRGAEQRAVFPFDKGVVLEAFFAGAVFGIVRNAGINDGDQVNVFPAHACDETGQVRNLFRMPGEVAVLVHIVDIQADTVDRNAAGAVLMDNAVHVFGRAVTPAALDVSEGPEGRKVGFSDQTAQFAADRPGGIAGDHIQREIAVEGGDHDLLHAGIPEIPDHFAGIIQKQTERPLFSGDHNEVMGAVQALPVLGVHDVIAVPGAVDMSALVDAAHSFAQAEDHVIGFERHGKGNGRRVFSDREALGITGENRQVADHGLGGKGAAIDVALNHEKTSQLHSLIILTS